jgi:hypothetical protein
VCQIRVWTLTERVLEFPARYLNCKIIQTHEIYNHLLLTPMTKNCSPKSHSHFNLNVHGKELLEKLHGLQSGMKNKQSQCFTMWKTQNTITLCVIYWYRVAKWFN